MVLAGMLCLGLPALSLADEEPAAEGDGQGVTVFVDPYGKSVDVDFDEGNYYMDVTMEGAAGKADITNPMFISVHYGKPVATVEWSGDSVTYMMVGGDRFDSHVNNDGNSETIIPIPVFNAPYEVFVGTASTVPGQEVAYALTIDQFSKIRPSEHNNTGPDIPLIVGISVGILALFALFVVIGRKMGVGFGDQGGPAGRRKNRR